MAGWVHDLEKDLPPLRCFILPGGGVQAAQLHVARTVARRLERVLLRYRAAVAEGSRHARIVSTYEPCINRVSDYLFVAARVVCTETGNKEVLLVQ